MAINRQEVFDKYDGHCAYCGEELSINAFQVDHIWPQARFHLYAKKQLETCVAKIKAQFNGITNLNPACRECNYEKRTKSMEGFRKSLGKKLHRLHKLFNFRIAVKYGQVRATAQPIVFYFETFEKKDVQ